MIFLKNKTISAIALLLMLTASAIALNIPAAQAHTPAWNIPTYAFLAPSSEVIGVNQPLYLYMWINWPPPTAGGPGGDRWQNYTILMTLPNNTTQTIGPFTSDDVATAYTSVVPQLTGIYTFVFHFNGQTLGNINPITGIPGPYNPVPPYVGDYFMPCTSDVVSVTVRQNPVTVSPVNPLPSGYWSRPIYGENTAWGDIASNWLGGSTIAYGVQLYGSAPESPHILWTKPMQFGGITGGSPGVSPFSTWYGGLSYEVRFPSSIIMNGYFFYNAPNGNNPTGGGTFAVNLQTGETIWYQNITVNFGQIYDYESPNQHGPVMNGYLWSIAGTTWRAYDPFTGNNLFNLTNVPGGTQVTGSDGSIEIYTLNAAKGYFTVWNNTASYQELLGGSIQQGANQALEIGGTNLWQWRPVGKSIDTGPTSNGTCYTGNYTIAPSLPGNASTTQIYRVIPGDMILGTSTSQIERIGTTETTFGTPDPWIMWAINLNPAKGAIGSILWTQSYPAFPGNVTTLLGYVDPTTRVWNVFIRETRVLYGYSLDNGQQLWGPTPSENDWNYYDYVTALIAPITTIAYGNIYTAGYGGILTCYNDTTGQVQWTYGNGGPDSPGNTTFSYFATPYGQFPIEIGAVADGKIYLVSTEHSPNSPLYKGYSIRAIDAFTGKELWVLDGWSQQGTVVIADGKLVFFNYYDGQIYALGQGPTATSVTTQNTVASLGSSVLIQGTVTDQSPGVKQSNAVSSNGLGSPAISDANMAAWMEYTYQQAPMPVNCTGVPVTLTAVDSSGKSTTIAQVTSDASGLFKATWTPPAQGIYTIVASFLGTKAYYNSYSETALAVGAASSSPIVVPTPTPTSPAPSLTTTPTTPTSPGGSPTEMYLVAAAAVVIIAIIITAAVLIRRRK